MSAPQEPPDAAPDDVDVPGLAGERTDLAWTRTALAAGVAATAMIRRSWAVVDTATGRVAVFSICGLGALAWTATLWSAYLLRTSLEGRTIADKRHLRALSVGTTAFSVVALILAVVPN